LSASRPPLPNETPAVEPTGSPRGEAVLWTLRFISGKYQGGEFPLRPNREIVIGRSSDLDMVLVEDMVSRKHAKIITDDTGVSIQDLGSTNGTFVNGEKIRKVELKDGDRILIGTSIVKLGAGSGEAALPLSEKEARSKLQVTANHRSSVPKSMSGNLEEIPLPDLLQLLSTSRKSGVLVLRSDWGVGRIFLRKGQIYYASLDEGAPEAASRKILFRMLGWNQGIFELEPADDRTMAEEMSDSIEALLMEGMRQLDEFRVVTSDLPAANAPVSVARPLGAKLRDLSPDELDVFELALVPTTAQAILDGSRLPDLDVARHLAALIQRGYFVVG
jgi:pSer/pThr/pTyr-binding forkhead associated (FHA) protein